VAFFSHPGVRTRYLQATTFGSFAMKVSLLRLCLVLSAALLINTAYAEDVRTDLYGPGFGETLDEWCRMDGFPVPPCIGIDLPVVVGGGAAYLGLDHTPSCEEDTPERRGAIDAFKSYNFVNYAKVLQGPSKRCGIEYYCLCPIDMPPPNGRHSRCIGRSLRRHV